MPDDDEEIRKQYQVCPNCECDLGGYGEILVRCVLCGHKLSRPITEILRCGCEVLRGWRCPIHGAP